MNHTDHAAQPASPRRRPTGALRLAVATAIAAAMAAPPALARAYHSQSLDDLIARCASVNTDALPEASLARYGIERNERRGVLSCVVQQRRSGHEPGKVEAKVSAQYHHTGQAPKPIHMRAFDDKGAVTYVGTFPVRTTGPMVFRVRLEAGGTLVEMNFDDQAPRQ